MRNIAHMNKAYPTCNYEDYRPSRNPYYDRMKSYKGSMAQPTGLSDEQTEEHRGKWRNFFGKPATSFLQLELGTYHGETSLHLAQQNPEQSFIGMEWKFKQCFKAAKKAKDNGLTNLCFLRGNISRLPWVVAPGEVDRVWILFPDPWSKASHQKHRVFHEGFFRTLGVLLNEGKEVLIKTDHAEYADYIRKAVAESGAFSPMPEDRAQAIWQSIPPTPFEKMFIKQGLKFTSLAFLRNQNLVVPPLEVQEVLAAPVVV